MVRKPKTPKAPGFARAIVAANLQALLDHHYKDLPNITQRQKRLEAKSGVRLSTIQRLMSQETGANLETLELLAGAFELSLYQLVTPTLEASNPQVIKGASKAEQHLYALFQRSQRSKPKQSQKIVLLDDAPAQEEQRTERSTQ